MALTPEQIARREFFTVLRGYDKAEVEEFLHEVASDYAGLLDAYDSARTAPVDAYENVGQEVSNLLKTARESSDSLLSQAQSKADEILRQAESDAKIAREKAEATAHDLLVDAERRVALLRQNEGELRARLEELTAMLADVKARLDDTPSFEGPDTEPSPPPSPPSAPSDDDDLIVITDPEWEDAGDSSASDAAGEETVPGETSRGAVRAPRGQAEEDLA